MGQGGETGVWCNHNITHSGWAGLYLLLWALTDNYDPQHCELWIPVKLV